MFVLKELVEQLITKDLHTNDEIVKHPMARVYSGFGKVRPVDLAKKASVEERQAAYAIRQKEAQNAYNKRLREKAKELGISTNELKRRKAQGEFK